MPDGYFLCCCVWSEVPRLLLTDCKAAPSKPHTVKLMVLCSIYHRIHQDKPADCIWTVPHHRVLKLFSNLHRPISLTVPLSCAATFFLPLVCIIIHLLKYVILLFHLWAYTCSSAKPQLTPKSYCRQRKHSVLLLSPVQPACPGVCFWLCVIIFKPASYISDSRESFFPLFLIKTWIPFKRNVREIVRATLNCPHGSYQQ